MSDKPHIEYIHMGQWPIFVGCTTSREAFAAEMKRMKISEEVQFFVRSGAGATTHFFTKEGAPTTAIVTILPRKRNETTIEQYAGLLAHEALHVVTDMRETLNKGEPFGNECEAYLLQYLTQSFMEIATVSNRTRDKSP